MELQEIRDKMFDEAEAIIKKVEKENRDFTDDEEMAYNSKYEQIKALDKQIQQARGGFDARVLLGDRSAYDLDGKAYPVVDSRSAVANITPHDDKGFTLAGFVRASMGFEGRATPVGTGTALVPQYLSANIIDMVRAKSRVVQAGAITIPIEGPTYICRIDADPTVYQHTEGTEDITESVPTFTPLKLDPKALVATVPLTMEVVEDAQNLDAALRMSLAGAFATKLDALTITTILADTNIATSAAGEDCGTWAGVMAAVGSMLDADMDIPTAIIANTADYADRAAEVAVANGVWLGAPPVLAKMQDLFTTNVATGTAILGDFAKGVAIAVRRNLQLEVVRFQAPAKATHLLVASARLEGYVLQPAALYIQKTTV